MIEPQSFWAAWNAGEFGSMPVPPKSTLNATPPYGPVCVLGSGKFGTPCERMHRDIARAWDLALAVWAAEGVPAFGMYERQACIAEWKAGPFTSTPFTVVLFGVCWIWRGRRPPLGSGKLETPCDRMQDANSSVLLLLASELWPADAFVAVPLGLDEPHAARPKAAAASRLMMIVNRMGASLRFGFASKHYEIGGKRPRCCKTIPTPITGIDTGFKPRHAGNGPCRWA